ncbi:hypothetical protein [Helicobacter fennelliae]|uniref:hypothetical protein n=1 Tax=Helicobacter fennelliae TaxID=215 RepID=UPI0011C02FD2|nr:hypothetical protein [Helicobacter fennelliae]
MLLYTFLCLHSMPLNTQNFIIVFFALCAVFLSTTLSAPFFAPHFNHHKSITQIVLFALIALSIIEVGFLSSKIHYIQIDDEMTALELCFLAILSLIALLLPRIQCFLDSASTHFANFTNVTNHTTSDTSYYSHTTQNPQNSSQHSLNAYFSILPIPFVFMMNICVLFVMRSFWLISHWFIMCAFIGGFTLGVCIYLHKSPTNTQKIWYLWILFIIGLGFLILDMSFGDFLSSAQYSIAPIFFILLAVYMYYFIAFQIAKIMPFTTSAFARFTQFTKITSPTPASSAFMPYDSDTYILPKSLKSLDFLLLSSIAIGFFSLTQIQILPHFLEWHNIGAYFGFCLCALALAKMGKSAFLPLRVRYFEWIFIALFVIVFWEYYCYNDIDSIIQICEAF